MNGNGRILVFCGVGVAAMAVALALSACGAKHKNTATRPRSTALVSTASKGGTPYRGGNTRYRGDEDDDDSPGPRGREASPDNDADFDNDRTANRDKGYLDGDDAKIADYGRPANAAELGEVRALVKRYYAAALAGDGATGCALIDATFKAAVPTDYGTPSGLPYSKGNTCAIVATKIFQHFHSQLMGSFAATRVRVKGSEGFVLIGSSTQPAGYFPMQREHGQWKLIGVTAGPLP